MTVTTNIYHSPCGTLILGSTNGKLCLCDWQTGHRHSIICKRLADRLKSELKPGTSPEIILAKSQLDEYFAGRRYAFNIPLLPTGTDFQEKVWNALLSIPFGNVLSYGAIADIIGMPKAVRAVANAIGSNALSIIVPCHRVIGNDGTLTGYGGGIETKRYLLNHENKYSSFLMKENYGL